MRIAPRLIAPSILVLQLLIVHLDGALAQGDGFPIEKGAEPIIRCPRTKQLHIAIESVAFAPDGKTLAAGDNEGLVRLYDPDTARERPLVHDAGNGITHALAYASGGKTLIAGVGLGNVKVLDAGTGHLRYMLESPIEPNRGGNTVAISADGKYVVCGDNTGEVVIWDATTGRRRAVTSAYLVPPHSATFPRAEYPIPAPVFALVFTPDGSALLSFAHGAPLRAWDPATGAERMSPIKCDRPSGVALSPNGKVIALIERNPLPKDQGGRITIWDMAAARKRFEWTTDCLGHYPTLIQDGRAVVSVEDDKVLRLRDSADGRTLATLQFNSGCHIGCLAVSSDGRFIAAGGFEGFPMTGVIHLIEFDGKTLRPWKPRSERR